MSLQSICHWVVIIFMFQLIIHHLSPYFINTFSQVIQGSQPGILLNEDKDVTLCTVLNTSGKPRILMLLDDMLMCQQKKRFVRNIFLEQAS